MRLIEEMIEAERHALIGREAKLERRENQEEGFPGGQTVPSRRLFLAKATVAVGAAVSGLFGRRISAAAPPGAVEYPVAADSTKQQGRPINAHGG